MATYIMNSNAIILFVGGKTHRIEKTDTRYPRLVEVMDSGSDEKLMEIIDSSVNTLDVIQEEEIEEVKGFYRTPDDEIIYNGKKLPKSLANKVRSIMSEGLPLKHFEVFWERLMKNPSKHSVDELTDFLGYRELPITEDGYFLAYKGVGDDMYSIHGNPSTTVIQGTVDLGGRIYNGVGEVVEVLRRDVDDVRENECSTGLHVGSLDYAKGWGSKTLVVKIDPADVVSVPKDCEFQKCRVSKYEVVAVFASEITAPVCNDETYEPVKPEAKKNRDSFIDRVDKYLQKKTDDGCSVVKLRAIQKIFSPDWPSREKVIDALQELELYFKFDRELGWVVELNN